MDAIALGLQQSDSSNFLNFHASVNLSMSRSRPTVFSSTELLDVDFLVQRRTNDRSRDGSSGNGGRSQPHSVVNADGKDFFERDVFTLGYITIIDVDFHAWFDFVLATAVDDDGVHDSISLWM